jgi:hypothetical protein
MCGCSEDHPCVDRRLPDGLCCWVAQGAKPMCSTHVAYVPDSLVPGDPLGPEKDERPEAPLLQTFTEQDMRTIVGIHDEKVRRLRDERRRIY